MRRSERSIAGAGVSLLMAALLAGTTAGCGEEAPAPEGRAEWPLGVVAAVDSGNAAYRAGDYQEARRHFRAAARAAPEVGTAWFGVYMAERALGNEAAADSALRRVGDLGDAARLHHGVPRVGDDGAEDGSGGGESAGYDASDGDGAEEPASPRHRDPETR